MSQLILVLQLVWAAPNSLLGIVLGAVGLMTGGRAQRVGRVLEFHGGAVRWFLEKLTLVEGGAAAMTLGHTVLGRTQADLDLCREHELVHVRQYERWGPIFLPAYLCCSAYAWMCGRHFYRDNRFEREAFDCSDPRHSY